MLWDQAIVERHLCAFVSAYMSCVSASSTMQHSGETSKQETVCSKQEQT